MAPIIHLVRHAEGFHNLSRENQQLLDPELTPAGKEQCKPLREQFPDHDKITHLVASPFRRTLHTCLLSFRPVVERGHRVVALPDVQEVLTQPCDTGSDIEVLKAEFGDQVDYSLLMDGWNDKSSASKYEPTSEKLDARTRDARLWLRELARSYGGGDAQIVLVTHGGILHFLTQDWDGMDLNRSAYWRSTTH